MIDHGLVRARFAQVRATSQTQTQMVFWLRGQGHDEPRALVEQLVASGVLVRTGQGPSAVLRLAGVTP